MELTNGQRKYLGLELIEPSWERVEIPNNCLKPEFSTGKDIFFNLLLEIKTSNIKSYFWTVPKVDYLN